jgi:enoyl-CoA hydratase/carnithine racemase
MTRAVVWPRPDDGPHDNGVIVLNTAEQFHVDDVSPAYWRVTFDNGPVNLLAPDTLDQLAALIERIESDPGAGG